MIWSLIIEEDRVVELTNYEAKKTRSRTTYERMLTSRTLVPSILHACSESRAVGIKLYEKLVFGGRFTGTYINWATDIISFQTTWAQRFESLLRLTTKPCNASNFGRNCQAIALRDDFGLFNVERPLRQFGRFENLRRVIAVQRTPTYPGFTDLDEGILTLLPLRESEVAGDESRLEIFRRATGHLNNLKKWMPRVKEVEIMTAMRGPERCVTRSEKLERRKRLKEAEIPKPWKISFKNYRVIELRRCAVERGLSDQGTKKDLMERLEANEEIRFPKAMEEYEQAMQEQTASRE